MSVGCICIRPMSVTAFFGLPGPGMSMFFATAVTLQQNVKSAQPYPSEEGLTLALWLQHGLAGAFEPKLTVLPSPGHPKQKPLLQLTPKQPFLVNSISHAGLCVANLAETRSSARDATLKPLPWFAPRLAGCHDRRDRPSSPEPQNNPLKINGHNINNLVALCVTNGYNGHSFC